jgi:hypothetical protein
MTLFNIAFVLLAATSICLSLHMIRKAIFKAYLEVLIMDYVEAVMKKTPLPEFPDFKVSMENFNTGTILSYNFRKYVVWSNKAPNITIHSHK